MISVENAVGLRSAALGSLPDSAYVINRKFPSSLFLRRSNPAAMPLPYPRLICACSQNRRTGSPLRSSSACSTKTPAAPLVSSPCSHYAALRCGPLVRILSRLRRFASATKFDIQNPC